MPPLERMRSMSLGALEEITPEFSTLRLDLARSLATNRARSFSETRQLPLIELGYSPSSRGQLIAALESYACAETCQNLASCADKFSPIELAILIACLLQQPFLADKKETLTNLFLLLARKYTSMHSWPAKSWNMLTELLLKQATLQELAQYLKDDKPQHEIEVDDSIYLNWERLTQGFNSPHPLHDLGLREVLLASAIEPWINSPCHEVGSVHALLLVYFMCIEQRQSSCCLQVLAATSSCQEFVLHALTKIRSGDRAFLFLECLNTTSHEEDWSLLSGLSSKSLWYVDAIFMKTNEIALEPAICLKILDNPNEETGFKLSTIYRTIRQMQTCDIAFLVPLAQKLKSICQDKNTYNNTTIHNILGMILSKKWNSTYISFTYDTQNILNTYYSSAHSFFDSLIVIMTHILPDNSIAVYDQCLYKYVYALIDNLFTFSELNTAALKKISPRALDMRLACSLEIKSAGIGLLFGLYKSTTTPSVKLKMYDIFKAMLPLLLVTDRDDEPLLEEDTATGVLYYGHFTINPP